MFSYADKPETIGKVLDNGFKLYKYSLKPVLLLSFLAASTGILYTFLPQPDDLETLKQNALQIFSIFMLIMLLGSFFYAGMIVHMHGVASNNKPSIANSLMVALKKLIPLIIGSIGYLIAFLLGLVLIVIPGIYISVALFFFGVIMLVDNEGIWPSLKTSFQLVKGNWWRTLALISVPMFILGALYALLTVIYGIYIGTSSLGDDQMAQDWQTLELVSNMINAAIGTFITPLFYAFLLVILHDLKLRKQGLDLEARLAEDK